MDKSDAGCILGETSLLELKQITISNDTLLKDDISELKQYHLISLGGSLPSGGARLIFPNSIRLMTDLIREKIADPKRIEKECAKLRAGTPKVEDNVGMVIYRVLAHWKNGDYIDALETAQWGNKKYKENADLKCLLGRAHMNMVSPNFKIADTMFRRAFELKCKRPELFEYWIKAKSCLKDWVGVIEVSEFAQDYLKKDLYLYLRAEAYGKAAEAAQFANNYAVASEYYLKGGKTIDSAINNYQSFARKNDLIELRSIYYFSYIKLIDQINADSRDYLETWLAIWELYESNFKSAALISLGLERLSDWWNIVIERDNKSEKTRNLFEIQIRRIANILRDEPAKILYPDGRFNSLKEYYENFIESLNKYDKNFGSSD